MNINPPKSDVQMRPSAMLIVSLVIGALVTLTVFVTALFFGLSIFKSIVAALLLSSPLTFMCILAVSFFLNRQKIDLVANSAGHLD